MKEGGTFAQSLVVYVSYTRIVTAVVCRFTSLRDKGTGKLVDTKSCGGIPRESRKHIGTQSSGKETLATRHNAKVELTIARPALPIASHIVLGQSGSRASCAPTENDGNGLLLFVAHLFDVND